MPILTWYLKSGLLEHKRDPLIVFKKSGNLPKILGVKMFHQKPEHPLD